MSGYERYRPQRDTIEDYVLLNAPRSAKEKPVCQTCCSLLVIAFAIAAMAVDELSDGDIDVDFTSTEEDIDFDCGWKHVLFKFTEIDEQESHDGVIYDDIEDKVYNNQLNLNQYYINLQSNIKSIYHKFSNLNSNHKRRILLQSHNGNHGNGNHNGGGALDPDEDGEETLSYNNNELCDELEEFDTDWCQDMKTAGILWLVFGILSILSSFIAIVAIWKVKHKASKCYLGWQLFSCLCMMIGTLYWMSEARCDEFEDIENETASMEVSIGASMTLMFVALGFGILALLQSVFYVCKRNQRELRFDYKLDLRRRAGLENDNGVSSMNANSVNVSSAAPGSGGAAAASGLSNNVTLAKITPKGNGKKYDQVADEENDDDA